MIFLLFIACSTLFPETTPPIKRHDVAASLTGNFRSGPLGIRFIGPERSVHQATVVPVRFSLRPGFEISGALWTPQSPTGAGVIVAHGHYGQGKSGAEAQEIAHQLAAAGALVLAVDTPGVEEWDVPERRIHFGSGAHNRGILYSRGSSAMALQLDVLRRGVDVLEQLGAKPIGATGASGGAVASFYLGWLDSRVVTAVMASSPPIPREAAASGCACDHIPGHPGPDATVLSQWSAPTLWMSDVVQVPPEGLSPKAEFEVFEGPHSYTLPMQERALDWFSDHLGTRKMKPLAATANVDLSTPLGESGFMAIADLPAFKAQPWKPQPSLGRVPRVDCQGEGPVMLTLGAVALAPIQAAGWRTCALSMPTSPGTDFDAAIWTESVGNGTVMADELAGAVAFAVRQKKPKVIWAHRAWGLIASTFEHKFVVHEPVEDLSGLRENDPLWLHVPGAWDGVIQAHTAKAVGVGDDPAALLGALGPPKL